MKVKEISRTANVAWSPSSVQKISVACGTVAQQLDATFSTSAKLEVFSLDLASPGLDMPLVGSVESAQRFHKVVWSGHQGDEPTGLIIGGSDNGVITVWSAEKVARSADDSLVHQTSQHSGAVRTLDVNPFQPNLLVSGAGESEIFIWDLNNLTTPMSPGNKIHPLEDISGVAWNRQVQHIMASTSPGGKTVVWDLRKNEPIIQVTDSSSKVRCSGIAWHPDVATQMVTASSDDRAPIIQMWDLRFATAPMRVLEHHTKGVLSVAWCAQDSDLLLSAAKDNQVLCWNPNTDLPGGEVVYELPGTSQWIFECQWCPRNPAIISTASFDGHVSMYSLLGGGGAKDPGEPPKQVDSDDVFAGLANSAQAQAVRETAPLKTPPKWLRRPCGASFSFGGKLVSFGNTRGASTPKVINVSQVITRHELVERSHELETSLTQQQFGEFCERKSQDSSSDYEKNLWNFLKGTFDSEPRRQYLKLLGYDTEELAQKFATLARMSGGASLGAGGGLDVNELSQKLATLPVQDEAGNETSEASSTAAMFGSETTDDTAFDGLSCDPSASQSKRVSTVSVLPHAPPAPSSFLIPTDSDTDGMLAKAVLVGNFEAAVDICIGEDRMSEALLLAVAGGADLLKRTQAAYFQKHESKVSKLISSVIRRDWTELARTASLDNWREILAALVTYAGPEEFAPLCDLLGGRLESENEGVLREHAALCYICSGNVDKFVECWSATSPANGVSGLALQDLIEKVVILRKAVDRERRQHSSSEAMNSKMVEYSSLLASQGSLETALKYIQETGNQNSCAVLYDRLYKAQGSNASPAPNFPFPAINVLPPQPVSQLTPKPQATQNTPTSSPYPLQPGAGQTGFGTGQARSGAGQTGFGTSKTGFGMGMGQPGVGMGQPGVGMGQPGVGMAKPGAGMGQPGVGMGQPGVGMGQPGVGMGQPRVGIGPQPVTQPLQMSTPVYNPVGVAPTQNTPPPPQPTTNSYNTDTPTTWNDPPTLRSKKPPVASGGPAPIMAPVMTPVMNPVGVSSEAQAPPTPQDSTAPPPQTTAPPPPAAEKAPIPQEHLAMVQAFEGMVERCKAAAASTAVKRKLDDISRKLGILCDLLRSSRLSPNVLEGLHGIALDIQSYNYQSGLARYTQMVTAGNFSEISSFMPGLKALLQLGSQLRV